MMADGFLRLTGMNRLQGIQWCDRMLFAAAYLLVVDIPAYGRFIHPVAFLFWMAFAGAFHVAVKGFLPYESEDDVGTVQTELGAGAVTALVIGGLVGFARWMGG